jgi:hypothetical protein
MIVPPALLHHHRDTIAAASPRCNQIEQVAAIIRCRAMRSKGFAGMAADIPAPPVPRIDCDIRSIPATILDW